MFGSRGGGADSNGSVGASGMGGRPSGMQGGMAIDPAALGPMMGYPMQKEQLEYVYKNEKGPFSGDHMLMNVGGCYFTGLTIGGAYGAVEGYRARDAALSSKLNLNRAVTSVTRNGAEFGNGLGTMALFYSCIKWTGAQFGHDDEIIAPTLSAAAAGALYKSTAGLRAMGAASVLGAAVFGGLSTARKAIQDGWFK